MKNVVVLLLTIAATMPCLVAQQKPTPPPSPSVESMMTVTEFREAGLQKLSPEELAALNRWLGRYAVAVSAVAPSRTPATPDVIETHIEGEFEGWDGETVFKLDNGQIWQQAAYAYTYHYAYRPKVLIFRSGGGYRMKVDGVTQDIAVKRLK